MVQMDKNKASGNVSWLAWLLARLLAIVGNACRSSRFSWDRNSSPRRLSKLKHSDLDLVHLGRESALREGKARLTRDLCLLMPIKGWLAITAIGLVMGGMYLYNESGNLWCSAVKAKKKVLADELGFMTPYEPYVAAFSEMTFGNAGPGGSREPVAEMSAQRRGQYMCAKALMFEQVGLLFLTHERVKNEAAWRRWFDGARGRLPLGRGRLDECLRGMKTGEHMMMDLADLAGACGVDPEASNPIDSQFLFDVWVHLKKGEDKAMFRGSIFEGSLVPDHYRVDSTWGGHSLIDATRVLFAAALTNPFVSKMVLVSDSDVPLYGPSMVYNQLLAESKSRVNACNTTEGWDRDLYRLRYDFIEQGVSKDMWRKSWQWVALERRHVQLVVQDIHVDAIFRSLCRPRWDHDWCDFRVCYSDEHYIPTLLAMHGLENETDCAGELTDRDWSRVEPTSAHPWEYRANDISEVLFENLRHPELIGCDRSMLIKSGLSGHFTTVERLVAKASRGDASGLSGGGPVDICQLARDIAFNRIPSYVALDSRCPLLARKFSEETADLVEALAGWLFEDRGS